MKKVIESLNENTQNLDKKNLKIKLKELKAAYKSSDRTKLDALSKEFEKISECLGSEDEEVLREGLESINKEIEKNGASELNIATRNNYEAKLDVIKYRPIINEAASPDVYSYPILEKKIDKKRNLVMICGVTAAVFGLAAGCSIKNKLSGENTETQYTSNSSITSTIEGDISEEELVDGTLVTTAENSGYTLETLDIDYSSPTRDTSISNGNVSNGTVSNGSTNATITVLNPTTNPDTVTVISTPTTTEATTLPTGTSAVETDINGTKPNQTESAIKPTGTDPLPVEPTNSTLSDDDLTGDYVPTTTTQATTTTQQTTQPTTTEPASTTITVPVVTVDPNDPNNIIDDDTVSKNKSKSLGLTIR